METLSELHQEAVSQGCTLMGDGIVGFKYIGGKKSSGFNQRLAEMDESEVHAFGIDHAVAYSSEEWEA